MGLPTTCRLAVFFLLLTNLPEVSTAQVRASDVVIGKKIQIFSKVLQEERAVLVSKPASYDRGAESYPVLFVLDGEDHFDHTTALTRFLALNRVVPEMLVVAIANTDRIRDLTPPAQEPRMKQLEPTHGAAASFQSFIAEELIPWVDQNYRTRPFKILVGHSLGGLFAVHSLTTKPELFNGYIAISPSLHWDEKRPVDRTKAFFDSSGSRTLAASLFVTASDEIGVMRNAIQQFAGVLEEKAPQGLEWRFADMPLETHGTAPYRGIHRGLEFLFADWVMRDPVEIHSRYGLQAIERFFAGSDRKYGDDRGIPRDVAIAIARHLEQTGQFDQAAELVVRYQPLIQAPVRVLESLAARLRERGNKSRAIELYRMALKGNPDSQAARQALAELGDDYSDLLPPTR